MSQEAILTFKDRYGREWIAAAVILEAHRTGQASLPLASEEAKTLDLRLTNIKVVER